MSIKERGFTVGDLLIIIVIVLISVFGINKFKASNEENALKENKSGYNLYKSSIVLKC